MKKIVMTVFCLIIAVILIVGIRMANRPPLTQKAEITTVEDRIQVQGLIVRDEHVFYATGTGTVYFGISEGERVSKDTLISKIYSGTVSEDVLKELSTIDKKIARAVEEENKSTLYSSDSNSVDSEIKTRLDSIYEYAQNMDTAKISEYKTAINNLRSANDDSGVTLTELREKKNELEASIGYEAQDIYTDISGVFSTYLDGLESVLEPDRIEQYTPSYISGLQVKEQEKAAADPSVAVGDPICKVVNNHLWYTVSVVNTADLAECKEGMSIKLRFKNMADAEVDGVVEYISEPDSVGNALVMIRCSTYLDSAFAYRNADIDMIFKSYTGYNVPVYAIRTKEDGSHMVIGESGTSRFNCDVDVLYTNTDDGYAIVQSSENAVNKLSKADRIVISEAS